MLFDLTRSYPNTIARAWDCDGEVNFGILGARLDLPFIWPVNTQVLLIEAAELLPPWLEPETSENRVFIADGRLHIVPLPSSSRLVNSRLISLRCESCDDKQFQAAKLPKEPSLRQGLAAVRDAVLGRAMEARGGTRNACDTGASEDIQLAISRRFR